MENTKPLKRHLSLQPLSRDHHHGLLLCWKIRAGFEKGVALERIKAYCDWFFAAHLKLHFQVEEQYVFPVLGDHKHPMVKRAMREHGGLRRLFAAADDLERHLSLLEETLTAHIRYEERIVFPEIQAIATPAQLSAIESQHHAQPFEEVWKDQFWL
ncbi:MAG: hemerythrin domain-containing protein [Saprospiraceae bacterium]|nr:hemerythrin domain-containing protein [Saprospiraceae bacterium]